MGEDHLSAAPPPEVSGGNPISAYAAKQACCVWQPVRRSVCLPLRARA